MWWPYINDISVSCYIPGAFTTEPVFKTEKQTKTCIKQVDVSHQFSSNDSHDDGVVAIHHLLALCSQTLIGDELAGFLQVPKNLTLQSQK